MERNNDFPKASRDLRITAYCEGFSRKPERLGNVELRKSHAHGREIDMRVCHQPPGTQQVEHRIEHRNILFVAIGGGQPR